MSRITPAELACEEAELLVERHTLFGDVTINVAPVIAVNLAFAINAATINSTATANAGQWITAVQHH